MKNIERTRLYMLCCLAFCFMAGCLDDDKPLQASLGWEGNQVKKIIIARELLKDIPEDSIKNHVHVRLAQKDAPDILGEVIVSRDLVVFEPLVPFTAGLQYELYFGNKMYSHIDIPTRGTHNGPEVQRIYPAADSLPENLLKVYIQFSHPMQEGSSAEHIFLVRGKNDTLKNVFLDLQPELWNHDRTILTLWLDPGRIKRDLQPNQQMGPPLVADSNYNLVVTPGWQDGSGLAIKKNFEKKFVTVIRDSISPDPGLWEIRRPQSGTRDLLTIELKESLDYQLLLSTIRIVDSKGGQVKGLIQVKADETMWSFSPYDPWLPGSYTIEIESKLEDLAGNNLNRLFDTDLTKPQKKDQPEIYRLPFIIN